MSARLFLCSRLPPPHSLHNACSALPPAGAPVPGRYNPAYIASPPYKIFVRTESPFLKDKLDVRMTLTIEELDGGASCRQVGGLEPLWWRAVWQVHGDRG